MSNGVIVAVMAGGGSRRMGRDKAAIVVDGMPMLERVVSAAVGAALPVLVVGRRRPAWWRLDDVRFVDDRHPGAGPLGGIVTALAAADGADVLALACDMPLLRAEAVAWLHRQSVAAIAAEPTLQAVIAINAGQPEPLFGLYRAGCRRSIEEHISQERFAVRELLAVARVARIVVPPHIAAQLCNMNEPRDFEAHGMAPSDT